MARPCQLHLAGGPVECSALPPYETAVLHAVEMTSQRRAFDADGAREVELCALRLALQRVQDQPDRDRPALVGQRAVERAADRFGSGGEEKSQRRSVGSQLGYCRTPVG